MTWERPGPWRFGAAAPSPVPGAESAAGASDPAAFSASTNLRPGASTLRASGVSEAPRGTDAEGTRIEPHGTSRTEAREP